MTTVRCDLSQKTIRRCYLNREKLLSTIARFGITGSQLKPKLRKVLIDSSSLSIPVSVKIDWTDSVSPSIIKRAIVKPTIITRVSTINPTELVLSSKFKAIPCHTDLLFDCSLLSVGDLVVGTTPSRKGVVGKVIRLDFIDNGSWHEMKAIEVEWMDGEIGNPYPNQMAKYVGCDRICYQLQ